MRFLKFLVLFCISVNVFGQTLENTFQQILKDRNAKVGVSVYDFKTKKSYGINQTEHFPGRTGLKFGRMN
jgi:hypothetical protein